VSEIEEPVTMLVRLLSKNMRVVKDDGSLASIYVSEQWYDRELFKNFDGQVTVGLDHSDDQKIGFSGTARRRIGFARVNIWSVDKPEQGVTGRKMRDKMRAEINRIIREKRSKPNETLYYFAGIGPTTLTHKAYHLDNTFERPPSFTGWTELTATEYEKLWYSDDNRFSKSVNIDFRYPMMLFRFKIDPDPKTVKRIVLKFEGYGTAPTGNGVTIKVWNFTASDWQNPASETGGADKVISITLTSNLNDYIDSNGYIYLFAKTTNPSEGGTAAILYCDYSECVITVEGITYCDIISYRDEDQVNVKPFIWRTEFTVRTWLFENVQAT